MIAEPIRAALDNTGVAYEILDCDPDLADTGAFCSAYGYPLETAANTIVVASQKQPTSYCACVLLATTRLDVNKKVCKLMGVPKASFATAEQTVQLTGMMIGGVMPFALPDHLPLYVDARVMEREWVIIGAGSRSHKIKLPPHALTRIAQSQAIEGLAFPRP